VFNQFGDLERCGLRPGNIHSADGWREMLEPVMARYRTGTKRRYFRGDAAFASPKAYLFLEAEGYGYTIRLPANAVLQRSISHLLKRRSAERVEAFYNGRGTAEPWIKEGKNAVDAPVVPLNGGQCGAAAASCSGLQSRQLPAHLGPYHRSRSGGH
jgi:hypothetical protein